MNRVKIITRVTLHDFIKQLIKQGKRVLAPQREKLRGEKGDLLLFKETSSFEEITWDYINTRQSIKEFFFPGCEKIFGYSYSGASLQLSPAEKPQPLVILGSRPCDAASIEIIGKLFNWDQKDQFFNRRRELNTLISFSCLDSDANCFCSSLEGLGPGGTRGSDLLLTPLNQEEFLLELVTEKGTKLVEPLKDKLKEGDRKVKGEILRDNLQKLGKRFEPSRVRSWLERHFEHPLWPEITRQCLGCGTCTFLCPTCYCFDLVDEANLQGGARFKNWDTCQMRLFTLHASGHNPRSTQDARYRQRIRHKYKYYPERFGETLCTGCGRCVRYCPVDLSIIEVLKKISEG